jgi:uncharacterized protein
VPISPERSAVRASLFNVPVPLDHTDDVFVLNTFTDAQAVVSRDVAALLARLAHDDLSTDRLSAAERAALEALRAEGFLVSSHDTERTMVREHFARQRDDTSQLRVTVLTTLQCNFACDYCVQGDHGSVPAGQRMSMDTAARTLGWIEGRLDALRPETCVLTFFGGEPLLNLPVVYFLAEACWRTCQARGVRLLVNVITNGLLLTSEVVDRLAPYGLNGIKVTLDGARDTHDQQRPLRGGQPTFDRIVENVRRVAGRCRIAIGGNFEESSAGSFEELLDYLAAQDFAPLLDKVAFKPVIRPKPAPAAAPGGVIPLALLKPGQPVAAGAASPRPAAAASSPCDTCHFVDDQMAALREATTARGFRTVDGVHMGPCELHKRHAYTLGPDGTMYSCPGFTGEPNLAVGHIDGGNERFAQAAAHFEQLSPWRPACGDCAFVPVCGGGCSVAAHTEQGDLHAPSCHKGSFEAGVTTLARHAVATAPAELAGVAG